MAGLSIAAPAREGAFLYGDLTCLRVGDKVLVYSPSSQRMAALSEARFAGVSPSALRRSLVPAPRAEPSTRVEPGRRRQVTFVTTSDCVQRCVYCFNDSGARKAYLSTDLALGVLDRVLEDPPELLSVKFFGGEPSLNIKLIRAVVDHLERVGQRSRFAIVTGGHLTARSLDWMIARDFAFTLSLDGPPDVQAEQRPLLRVFERLLDPEQALVRLAAAAAAFKVRVTVTERNVSRLVETVSYLATRGAKLIHIEPVNLSGRASEGIGRPEPALFAEQLLRAIDEASRLGVEIIHSSYMKLLEGAGHYCETGRDNFIVDVDGHISLCYEISKHADDPCNSMIVGRYDPDSRSLELPDELGGGCCGASVLPRECMSCYARAICGGGCPARNIADAHQRANPGGYFCQVTKHVTPEVLTRIARAARLLEENDHETQ